MPFTSAGFHLSQREERRTKNSLPNVHCGHIWAQWSQMTTVILPAKTPMEWLQIMTLSAGDEILLEYSAVALTVGCGLDKFLWDFPL